MGTQDVNVSIMIEEGDVLGATPSENLVITRIQAGTLADGKLQEGDKIIKVNNHVPQDSSHFYKLVVGASRTGHLNMVVRRDKMERELLKETKIQVPKERLGNLRIRDGFHYKLVTMEYQRGDRIGLAIKDYMNCVIVSKAPEGTMAGRVLKVGEQIVDVDSVRVTDKVVAQELIIAAIKKNQKVTMVIALAESEEARKWVEEALAAKSEQPAQPESPTTASQPVSPPSASMSLRPLAIVSKDPPSIRLKADVRRIAMQEIERRRTASETPLRSAIRTNAKDSKRVTFNSTLQAEHLIVNENPNANLRPVK